MKNMSNNLKKLSLIFIFIIFNIEVKAIDVDAQKFQILMKGSDIQIIDLRTSSEVKKTGVIKGAIVKNYFDSDFSEYIKKLDHKKKYLIYCASGGRSGRANKLMEKVGLNVFNLIHGMNGWLAQKLQTTPLN